MTEQLIAANSNLSDAWLEVLARLVEPGIAELSPVVVNVEAFSESGEPQETNEIRARLDDLLAQNNSKPVATVANTIFPDSLWNPQADRAAQLLYSRYERIWNRVAQTPANRNGVYFRRLTAFAPRTPHDDAPPINQLQTIIDTYRAGNHRRSALQASIFDPTRDHSDARRRGFPCLQQVTLTPLEDGGLAVTGFYASQCQVEKAYGNYLGLARLGKFMASEMGLRLVRMTCMASRVVLADSGVFGKRMIRQQFGL